MLLLDPHDPQELAFALHKAVKKSGLSHKTFSERLQKEYGAELTVSGLSRIINCDTIRFQRALQILAMSVVVEIGGWNEKSEINERSEIVVYGSSVLV